MKILILILVFFINTSCTYNKTDRVIQNSISKIIQKTSLELTDMIKYTVISSSITEKLNCTDIECLYLNQNMSKSIEIMLEIYNGEIAPNNSHNGKRLKPSNQVTTELIMSAYLEEITEFIILDDENQKPDQSFYEGFKLYKQTISFNYFEMFDIFISGKKQYIQDNNINAVQYQLYKFENNKLFVIPVSLVYGSTFQSYLVIKEFTRE